jgi:hypothetical protein
MTYNFDDILSEIQINVYTSLGLTVNGTKGGLLLGQSHENGGIPVLIKIAEGYKYYAEFEGDEYLINTQCYNTHADRLKLLNQPHSDKYFDFYKSLDLANITTINCKSDSYLTKSKFLLLDSNSKYFVVNKYSTLRHSDLLERLNSEQLKEENQFDLQPDKPIKSKNLSIFQKLKVFLKL